MTRMHEAVESAIAAAPLIGAAPNLSSGLSQFTDKPDNYSVHLNPDDRCEPHVIYTEVQRDNFPLVFEAIGAVTGSQFDEQFMEYALHHEKQHWQAAVHLGATSGRLGVAVYKMSQRADQAPVLAYQPFCLPRSLKTTRLGAALLSAYPLKPSQGDLANVKALGYGNLQELVVKAAGLNSKPKDSSETFYPVPLSAGQSNIGLSCGGLGQALFSPAW